MTGIYIHIPFCVKKCAYCDFVSYPNMEEHIDAYITALTEEMKQYKDTKADTVFIGGGTPSLLNPNQTEKLTRAVFDNFKLCGNYEFTMEANPGTLDDDRIAAMLKGGINRVSVGVQSFNDTELKAIGRIHDARTAYGTVLKLHKAGFNNINIDLMTGLPGQTLESLKRTLDRAMSLPVTHISAYSLIIEDGTPLEKAYSTGRITLPGEDADREMYSYTFDFLASKGFNRYEISNFAKKSFECEHNIKYWTFKPYIGLGVAAHSFDGNTRSCNSSNIKDYMEGIDREVTRLSRQDRISEFIITGLRMDRGIDTGDFKRTFNEDIESLYGKELKKFISLDLMKYENGFYSLTSKGVDISNSVLCEFV